VLFLENSATPMMQQWHHCKAQAKDALLLFRLGDFYEAFYKDAEIISKEVHLTLTHRQQIPMCGVPHHAFETYVDKLIAKGYKIAIAEQLEDPKVVKGLVKRDIVRVLSPGTIIQSSLLTDKANNFFLSLSQVGEIYGSALLDLSTGEFRLFEMESKQALLDEIFRLRPAEILVSEKFRQQKKELFQELSLSFSFCLNAVEDFRFDPSFALDCLRNHFDVQHLDAFGIKDKIVGVIAAGALLSYVKDDLRLDLKAIRTIRTENLSHYMTLDRCTLSHLEILSPLTSSGKDTLLSHLDKTQTPMGGRLLARWVGQPLLSPILISERQDAVEELKNNPELLLKMKATLSSIRDLERILIKIASNYANPKDLLSLSVSLHKTAELKNCLKDSKSRLLFENQTRIADHAALIQRVQEALVEDPPVRLSDGKVFRDGYSAELDEWKKTLQGSKDWVAAYQTKLRDQFGIKTLKVGFTNAFGYYIEISKGQSEKAPDFFHRRQTLINAERFTTDELKEFESKIMVAEERIQGIENQLFDELKKYALSFQDEIQRTSEAVAACDVICSFALVASECRYTRPVVDDSLTLSIQKGRHPIIERKIPSGTFISNDVSLNPEEQLHLITGPNMAGKSTFIRQVALIAIMAQIGSFVPAESAHIGVVDRVFSRIGASDDLARGQSTFMVEMTETANILHNASSRSLVILDEIGRGTSTYDGLSIAWAVAEYLLTTEQKKAKTLFATHYWELTQMEGKIPGAVNYQVAVKETAHDIVFLRKIVRGGTDKSYGIHVAKLAGIPLAVIKKAESLLSSFEKENRKAPKKAAPEEQLSFLAPPTSPALDKIKKADLNSMTPIQAHEFLQNLQRTLSGP
jgi:DNA mismatch repair protein MutS